MVRSRASVPLGHGELVLRPDFSEWASTSESNRSASEGWAFVVGGDAVAELRSLARKEALGSARSFSARLGVTVREPGPWSGPIVMTGHQPELFHPGVWVKYFLLQRIAEEMGATAVDIVVDSDGYDTLAMTAPCMSPEVRRCRQYLAVGSTDSCYACSPVPSQSDLDEFCHAGDQLLATLPAPSVRRHFQQFCEGLRSASADATSLSELLTFSRRRYEAAAGTDYLELPVTHLVRGEAYARFVADIALDADRFTKAYNRELAEYRALTRTRSPAQPFPDLAVSGSRFELPFWGLRGGRRETIWADVGHDSVSLLAGGDVIVTFPADAASATHLIHESGVLLAPKAVALTTFLRLFCCDLFIHGVGGGRYDAVTDGICRRYYGIEPPAFVVASLTMYLPLGAHAVTDEEIAAARERLNRLEHNPDALLGEVDFDQAIEREEARALAAEKKHLVEQIALPGADKKQLGVRIREVNARLSELLAPLRAEYEGRLASLEAQMKAHEIFTDRGYPYCYWSPEEVADKVR